MKWPWYKYKAEWSPIYVDAAWEKQTRENVPQKLKEFLKSYNGFGWYAQSIRIPADWQGRKVGLFFGAVDEAALIFVNGKQVYKREFKHEDDWRAPFIVPITEFIDWNRKNQLVTVRVEDNDGAGGIWQPVFLVRMP